MESRFLPIAYAIQFVVTLISVFEVWTQVGGQGHLDLIPWHYKLLLACSLSIAAVKATAAAVRTDRFWNRWTSAWLAIILALIVGMGLVTYYEHLHEPSNEGDEPPSQINLGRSRPDDRECRAAPIHLFQAFQPGAGEAINPNRATLRG